MPMPDSSPRGRRVRGSPICTEPPMRTPRTGARLYGRHAAFVRPQRDKFVGPAPLLPHREGFRMLAPARQGATWSTKYERARSPRVNAMATIVDAPEDASIDGDVRNHEMNGAAVLAPSQSVAAAEFWRRPARG